ncbi:MAG: BolA family protein [Bacteriovoracia bacterium]
MNADQLKQRIQTLGPDTSVELVDLTGTQDHWQAIIVSPVFRGKTLIEQHRMVFALLEKEVASNEVHALTLKTYSPEQYSGRK